MNAAIERMGKLYGKLGLSTSPELIAARGKGVEAAYDEFKPEHIASVLGTAFALNCSDQSMPLAEQFEGVDPTFDVRQNHREGELLATVLLSFELQSGSEFAPKVALAVTTAALGGMRPLKADADVIGIAAQTLANEQSKKTLKPAKRTYQKAGKALTEAFSGVPESGQVDVSLIKPVLDELHKYAEGRAGNAASSDEEILNYVSRLEEEMRMHWWVVGAWSNHFNRPFREMEAASAAIGAGIELAGMTSLELGLFAAPALLDIVLMKDRAGPLAEVTLSNAASLLPREYRASEFGALAQSAAAPWLPLSAAMGLAAESNDEKDWEARFKRLTGINPKAKIKPLDLAVQIYRERLAAPLFA